jgi:DNA replication and repair protein RecF
VPTKDAAPSHGPRITGLTLVDFRSFEKLDVKFSGRPVVLCGENGVGKTNLLEALSLLGAGRGMRHARFADIIRQSSFASRRVAPPVQQKVAGRQTIAGAAVAARGASSKLHLSSAQGGMWQVAVSLRDEAGDETRIGMSGGGDKRQVRIDGSAAPASHLLDYIRFLWLTPAQDRLFMEGASERRRFLDRMTLAHDGAHAKRVAGYEQALRQRQKLLEDWPRCDETLLAVLERQMAESGIAIAAARLDMVAKLALGAQNLASGAFPVADVALEGFMEERLGHGVAADVEDEFAHILAGQRRLDAQAGRALMGPHRSDLIVHHREKRQAARLCSTGEQKALLIGLVLANAEALARDASGRPLVLLLDEIVAHLDGARRESLFDMLEAIGFQAFLTGTDSAFFADFGARAEHFELRDGQLFPIPENAA